MRRSRIQGRGAFALRPIRKGQRVDEYVGQRISHDEADRRYDDNDGRHHTFLFVLDDDIVLDARYGGSDARFLNHACDPNCESVIERDRVWIKALKAIKPETELVYDYRFEWQEDFEPEDNLTENPGTIQGILSDKIIKHTCETDTQKYRITRYYLFPARELVYGLILLPTGLICWARNRPYSLSQS